MASCRSARGFWLAGVVESLPTRPQVQRFVRLPALIRWYTALTMCTRCAIQPEHCKMSCLQSLRRGTV